MKNKKRSLCLIVVLLVAIIIPSLSGDTKIDFNDVFHYNSRTQDETDIPTWMIGDAWVYEADIYSNTENGVFDITSDDLTVTVKNVSTIIHNEILEHIYMIAISGNISGIIESDILSGDITGEINGNASIRQADLSLLNSNITTSGIIEYLWVLESDFLIRNSAEYYPRFEYFDFPIKTQEEWDISTTSHQYSVFYVENFFPENTSEGNASMDGYAECLSVEIIQVPAGTFNCFHLLSENNGSIESWYAPEIKNVARMYMINENETETSKIWMNLSSYNLNDQDVTFLANFSSSTVNVSDPVTISGFIQTTSDQIPLQHTNVSIHIPYTNDTFVVTTDHQGFFSHTFKAPLLLDPTNTTYDIGSDGVILSVDTDSFSAHKVITLTVIGIAINDVYSIPQNQYQTKDVNLTCMIYSVEDIASKTVSITGPENFTAINVSLLNAGKDEYFFKRSYPVDGNYSYYIWAQNSIGNSNKTKNYNFTIIPDLTSPSIKEVTVEPNPQWENKSMNISCIVTDNVEVNTTHVLITDPYGNQFNITLMEKNDSYYHNSSYTIVGNYSYYIWAQDTVGNTNASSTQFFSILPQIPEITNVIVQPNPQELDGYVNISCTVTDNYGVDSVRIQINAPNGSALLNDTMNHSATDTYYFNQNYSLNGTYSFFIWANDTCGYTNTSSTYTFNILNESELLINIFLKLGWNLITLPVETGWDASDLAENIPGCDSVNRWDQFEQSYDGYLVDGPASWDFPLEAGYGYFVETTMSSMLSVTGESVINVDVPLEVSWNLIGWYDEEGTTAMGLAENISGCVSVNRWNASVQSYDGYLVGGPASWDFDITQGMGLFVEVNESSIWNG